MKKALSYILRKRFSAYLITTGVILSLFVLKVFGNIDADFVIGVMDKISQVGIAYMGTQTVSDLVKEYRNQ